MRVEKDDLLFPGMPALVIAIEAAGSQTALARRIGVSTVNVWNWLNRDHLVPLDRVPFIVAAAQHDKVTPRSLRPDYGLGWSLLARQLGTCMSPLISPDDELDALNH
ncbi:DNA-binding transcriptional regulator YdaS (Cro superfamily) [Paraburkholderia sp. HC6.4b]|uniref:transcriptional regulator n=1 Tax=unclassified Paraburkholderia TaxID=2615204 RepID=UPI0016161FD3|nr:MULTISPECIES: YdaS family helix-turn-helix protein [unclassified Paraburkholderia]MBB5408575.1 DNA-binding transcriptional regulator YdaS (Cro superfamily) [Paraburkholderia sp. HC6.4b]MBB5450407.1 DNA-binding transcriptional regulator YdaS (Cro superfamily) [Paraburkholderia sp. Kb1A]